MVSLYIIRQPCSSIILLSIHTIFYYFLDIFTQFRLNNFFLYFGVKTISYLHTHFVWVNLFLLLIERAIAKDCFAIFDTKVIIKKTRYLSPFKHILICYYNCSISSILSNSWAMIWFWVLMHNKSILLFPISSPSITFFCIVVILIFIPL